MPACRPGLGKQWQRNFPRISPIGLRATSTAGTKGARMAVLSRAKFLGVTRARSVIFFLIFNTAPMAGGHARVESTKFGALTPGVSNPIPVLPGGVGRAGTSAKSAQGAPLWATLSTGPKKAPFVCYYRAWGALNYQNIDSL
jgi:hypothetical protein